MQTGFMSVRDLNPKEVRDKVRSYRSLNVNLTQVQPVVGLVEFLTDAGPPIVIPGGQQRTMYQDAIGDSNAGGVDPAGIGLQACDATFFNSQVPNGQLILLEGMGLSIQATDPGLITPADVINIISNVSVLMNLRQRPVPMSAIIDWPSIGGNDAISNNGRQIVGRVQFDEPLLLEPQDNFQIVFRAERDIVVSNAANQYQIRAYMPATRIYDERVLGVS